MEEKEKGKDGENEEGGEEGGKLVDMGASWAN